MYSSQGGVSKTYVPREEHTTPNAPIRSLTGRVRVQKSCCNGALVSNVESVSQAMDTTSSIISPEASKGAGGIRKRLQGVDDAIAAQSGRIDDLGTEIVGVRSQIVRSTQMSTRISVIFGGVRDRWSWVKGCKIQMSSSMRGSLVNCLRQRYGTGFVNMKMYLIQLAQEDTEHKFGLQVAENKRLQHHVRCSCLFVCLSLAHTSGVCQLQNRLSIRGLLI